MNGYTQTIPGITAFTPVTQLRSQQVPMLSGLGDANATPASGTGISILDNAAAIVAANPLPALALIAFLAFRK